MHGQQNIQFVPQVCFAVCINLFKILEARVHPLLPDVLLAGGSGEVVSLDVGQCQKSCTSVPPLMESHIVDFDSAASTVSASIMQNQHELKLREPFNAGVKSLRATLPDEIFYCGFCFLNHAIC
jgi:hypothetical protein